MEIQSHKMVSTHQVHLHHSHSLNANYLLQHRLSRGSSGVESMSSCSPALDTAWDWETCGGSPTFVTAMAEVSGP